MASTKTVTRSAKTGQFVESRKAVTAPKTTVTDTVPTKHQNVPTRSVSRDAGTGEFISRAEANRRPATTVTERVRTPGKK